MDRFCVTRKRKLLDVFVLLTNNGNHTSVPSITTNNGLNKTYQRYRNVLWLSFRVLYQNVASVQLKCDFSCFILYQFMFVQYVTLCIYLYCCPIKIKMLKMLVWDFLRYLTNCQAPIFNVCSITQGTRKEKQNNQKIYKIRKV